MMSGNGWRGICPSIQKRTRVVLVATWGSFHSNALAFTRRANSPRLSPERSSQLASRSFVMQRPLAEVTETTPFDTPDHGTAQLPSEVA
ncbi:hypothetical protein GCM10010279_02920 [Streptomyces mutabilis]|nr:hypothetical protein GCM10010279_02920 [Streptomyces mutabilis]